MEGQIAALFDLDGVVVDTESQYTEFWGIQNDIYLPNSPNMRNEIKGSTLSQIYNKYFKDQKDIQDKITKELNIFESKMEYQYIDGVINFFKDLKKNKVKMAIVTSSNDEKMKSVYLRHPELKGFFDCIITADKITKSKPNPECYMKAADELGVPYSNCYVFEDSFAGLSAGMNAKMTVVGLATTNKADDIKDKCNHVIPTFKDFTYKNLLTINHIN